MKNNIEYHQLLRELVGLQKNSEGLSRYLKQKAEMPFQSDTIISVALLEDQSQVEKKDIFVLIERNAETIKNTKCFLYQI